MAGYLAAADSVVRLNEDTESCDVQVARIVMAPVRRLSTAVLPDALEYAKIFVGRRSRNQAVLRPDENPVW